MNIVTHPFWEDWNLADPANFIMPDALHQWHLFFGDHILGWGRIILGDREINRRYTTLQKRVGYRHFNVGFTCFSQHTGHKYRDIQRSFIAVIAGQKSEWEGDESFCIDHVIHLFRAVRKAHRRNFETNGAMSRRLSRQQRVTEPRRSA